MNRCNPKFLFLKGSIMPFLEQVKVIMVRNLIVALDVFYAG